MVQSRPTLLHRLSHRCAQLQTPLANAAVSHHKPLLQLYSRAPQTPLRSSVPSLFCRSAIPHEQQSRLLHHIVKPASLPATANKSSTQIRKVLSCVLTSCMSRSYRHSVVQLRPVAWIAMLAQPLTPPTSGSTEPPVLPFSVYLFWKMSRKGVRYSGNCKHESHDGDSDPRLEQKWAHALKNKVEDFPSLQEKRWLEADIFGR